MANLDPATLMALGVTGILIVLAVLVLSIILNAIALWVTAKLFKLKDSKYKTAFTTSVVAAIANLVIGIVLVKVLASIGLILTLIRLVVAFVVNSLLIKQFYKLETGKSFLVGLVWTITGWIISFIIALVIGAVLVAVFLAKYKGTVA